MGAFRLTSLTLEGFKSFANRVVLSFPGAITAIVGPNGTGKSNLADAITWVLGEQSARLLRSQSMADVIFNGSPQRPPLGAAEVALSLKMEGLDGASDGNALEISRRVFRDGASEYRLGGRRVRLKDIADRLMDAGLGTRAYAIIEQGRIGQVLSLRSTDRRALFEEAAGITKFRVQRHEAELKLAQTRANLERVADIAAEVRRALEQARRQARRAERHRELRRSLLLLRAELLAAQQATIEQAVERQRAALLAAEAGEAEAAAALARAEATLEEHRRTLESLRERLALSRQEEARSDSAAQRREAEEAAARRELAEAEARRVTAGEDVQRLGVLLATLRAEEETLATAVTLAESRSRAAEIEAQKAAAAARESEESARGGAGAAEDARRLLLAAVAATTEARNRLHRIEVELEQGRYQLTRLAGEHERLRTHLAQTAQDEAAAAERQAAAGSSAAAAEAGRRLSLAERDQLTAEAAALRAARDRAAHERWQAHHERQGLLHTLASARALPQVLARALPDEAMLGAVADFLDPPPEVLPLLEQAYRELLTLPVVDGEP
ncbi:MAG: AAA family ATPase, partial [Acidobacteriota bacterium]